MSENKKYYYLKLKENFYEQDHIKYVETLTNGYIYSNILMKLYLKAIKHEGKLMITEGIPYDPNNLEPLAKVIGHDPSHVCDAVNLAIDFKLIKIIDMRVMYITDIQNYIGHSSTEADRIRDYRSKLKQIESENKKAIKQQSKSVQMYDKSTPEIEIDTEIEKEKEKEIVDKKSTLLDSVYKEIENKYFKLFIDKFGNKPDYKYKRDRGILKTYIDKYGKDNVLNHIDIYFNHEIGDFYGYTITGLQSCYNKILTKTKNPARDIKLKTGAEVLESLEKE